MMSKVGNFPEAKRLFTGLDLKDADTLSTIYAHMVDPDNVQLNEADQLQYEKLQKVYAILANNSGLIHTTNAVLEAFPVLKQQSQARRLILLCKQLFGNFSAHNANFDRAILAERYINLANRCKHIGDMEGERKALDSYMKLMGFDKHIKEEAPPAKPPTIVFTSNPDAFTDAEIVG